jgi:RNA polymerase sigma factor (sigma-70 family)
MDARQRMDARQHLIQLFSTFIQFEDDRFRAWLTAPKLKRSMQRCLEAQAKSGSLENADLLWAKYWQQQWISAQSSPEANDSSRPPARSNLEGLAIEHLSAYLQETCYWVAHRMAAQVANPQYTLPDCFQIAIATVAVILNKYSFGQGASLKTYASIAFGNTIRDVLRQQKELNSRTDWGLLRKLSQKQFVESLQADGLAEPAIAQHRLAWTCFKTCCAPEQSPQARQLPQPDRAHWETAAALYNRLRQQQEPVPPPATTENLEKWLKRCASRARNYLHPTLASLNQERGEPGSGELLDDVPDPSDGSPLTLMLAQEEQQEQRTHQAEMMAALQSALAKLDAPLQEIFHLYYCKRLTQQQIAAHLNAKQYTVSRRLTTAKEKLLRAIALWSQESLHISLTSPALNTISLVIEEWLDAHYQNATNHSSKGDP